MSFTYYDGKAKRDRTLTDVSLTMNDDTGKLYVVGVDNKTGRQHSRMISRRDAMKLFSMTRQDLNAVISKAASDSTPGVPPMNDVPAAELPDAEVYTDPYYVEALPRVQMVMPKQSGKGIGQTTTQDLKEDIADLRQKIHRREFNEANRRATYNLRRRNRRREENERKSKQDDLSGITKAMKSSNLDGLSKEEQKFRKELNKYMQSGSGNKQYTTGVYRGPKTKAERERIRAELMEHFEKNKNTRAKSCAQKGGLSPGLISGIADGLGKAAEGMHGTFQKGLDNISKQRQREFEKNQMTGWYDRKGARNDRRQGARNMKQIANNMDYIRKEYIKERGIPLTDEQVFQMALEFAGGA